MRCFHPLAKVLAKARPDRQCQPRPCAFQVTGSPREVSGVSGAARSLGAVRALAARLVALQ